MPMKVKNRRNIWGPVAKSRRVGVEVRTKRNTFSGEAFISCARFGGKKGARFACARGATPRASIAGALRELAKVTDGRRGAFGALDGRRGREALRAAIRKGNWWSFSKSKKK